jgi:hypothetical protein
MMALQSRIDAVAALLEAMAARGLRHRNRGAVVAALLRGGLVRFACHGRIGPPAWAPD